MEAKNQEHERTYLTKTTQRRLAIIIATIVLLLAFVAYTFMTLDYEARKPDPDPGVYPKSYTVAEIVSVWNNNGKISFVIRNAGNHVFTYEEASNFLTYINAVPQDNSLLSQCITQLREPGTTCQIDTDVDFPTIIGLDNAVEIKVLPPFGRGDVYSCAIKSPEDKTY